VFLQSPLALGLLALAAVTVFFSFWAKRKSAATLAQAAARRRYWIRIDGSGRWRELLLASPPKPR
jgi:hypothetical protein